MNPNAKRDIAFADALIAQLATTFDAEEPAPCRLCGEPTEELLNEAGYHPTCVAEYAEILDEIASARAARDWGAAAELIERTYAPGERALEILEAAGIGPATHPATAATEEAA